MQRRGNSPPGVAPFSQCEAPKSNRNSITVQFSLTGLGPLRDIVGGVHVRIPSADEVSRREVLLDKRTHISDHADVPLVCVEGLVSNDVRCHVISYNEFPAEYGIFNDVSNAESLPTLTVGRSLQPRSRGPGGLRTSYWPKQVILPRGTIFLVANTFAVCSPGATHLMSPSDTVLPSMSTTAASRTFLTTILAVSSGAP